MQNEFLSVEMQEKMGKEAMIRASKLAYRLVSGGVNIPSDVVVDGVAEVVFNHAWSEVLEVCRDAE